jgi:hypothetical protein
VEAAAAAVLPKAAEHLPGLHVPPAHQIKVITAEAAAGAVLQKAVTAEAVVAAVLQKAVEAHQDHHRHREVQGEGDKQ